MRVVVCSERDAVCKARKSNGKTSLDSLFAHHAANGIGASAQVARCIGHAGGVASVGIVVSDCSATLVSDTYRTLSRSDLKPQPPSEVALDVVLIMSSHAVPILSNR